MRKVVIVIVVAFVGALLWGMRHPDENYRPEQQTIAELRASVPKVEAKADPALQKKRLEIIDGLFAKGVFVKIEDQPINKLFVGPLFMALDLDKKQSFVGVYCGWVFDLPVETERFEVLRIFDPKTGKAVGSFSTKSGLTMD